jgi:hypothetical protein
MVDLANLSLGSLDQVALIATVPAHGVATDQHHRRIDIGIHQFHRFLTVTNGVLVPVRLARQKRQPRG